MRSVAGEFAICGTCTVGSVERVAMLAKTGLRVVGGARVRLKFGGWLGLERGGRG